jgi:predicted RNase H-like HicB family nuclease
MTYYLVIIEQYSTPTGTLYGAFAPDVPGCTATGSSVEHALRQMQQVLVAALRRLHAAGKNIPAAHSMEEHLHTYRQAGSSREHAVVALLNCSQIGVVEVLHSVGKP